MQDHADPCKWTIVERYKYSSGVLIHDANPYFDAFGAYMGPLLDQPVDVRRFNELNASKHVPCRLDGM
uniref:Uncharacterized protein n=1 Tax=Hyaloperonospora arabidopsidis (strain Emoy2) TaxID=559515 RepID=M4BNQ4_HYAAE